MNRSHHFHVYCISLKYHVIWNTTLYILILVGTPNLVMILFIKKSNTTFNLALSWSCLKPLSEVISSHKSFWLRQKHVLKGPDTLYKKRSVWTSNKTLSQNGSLQLNNPIENINDPQTNSCHKEGTWNNWAIRDLKLSKPNTWAFKN